MLTEREAQYVINDTKTNPGWKVFLNQLCGQYYYIYWSHRKEDGSRKWFRKWLIDLQEDTQDTIKKIVYVAQLIAEVEESWHLS
jgi:hypothetical protein